MNRKLYSFAPHVRFRKLDKVKMNNWSFVTMHPSPPSQINLEGPLLMRPPLTSPLLEWLATSGGIPAQPPPPPQNASSTFPLEAVTPFESFVEQCNPFGLFVLEHYLRCRNNLWHQVSWFTFLDEMSSMFLVEKHLNYQFVFKTCGLIFRMHKSWCSD